jgi:hypothetical protein
VKNPGRLVKLNVILVNGKELKLDQFMGTAPMCIITFIINSSGEYQR